MDLNADGKIDVISGQYVPGVVKLFAGNDEGFEAPLVIAEYENTTDENGEPLWTGPTIMSTANFVDWEGDGDLDMLVGNVSGEVYLNLNLGTAREYRFGARSQLMVDGLGIKVGSKSDPLAVDWDDDGLLDLLVGDEAGDITWFRRAEDGSFETGVSLLTGKRLVQTGYRAVRESLGEDRILPGYRLRLEVCDWNNDGHKDLLVGNCETKDDGTTGFVYLFLGGP